MRPMSPWPGKRLPNADERAFCAKLAHAHLRAEPSPPEITLPARRTMRQRRAACQQQRVYDKLTGASVRASLLASNGRVSEAPCHNAMVIVTTHK